VLPAFSERVLPFDVQAALQWGAFMGDGERAGAVPSNDDAKIAAVASVHGLTVVTANERDFAPLGVPTVNSLRYITGRCRPRTRFAEEAAAPTG
jgi:predicted nucleic acid-binding protein